jgi:HSP20 family protein
MAIARYTAQNPWGELDRLAHRLSRITDWPNGTFPQLTASPGWVPAVSVEETPTELVLTAELPGVAPADVEIEMENNVLTLRGQKSEENIQESDRRVHVWERSYGSFQRSFTLPRTVKADQISADFDAGLLRIRMPKAPEARSRKIEISSTSEVK